ncbi:hypothetical protein [Gordonia sihwensis]|uniref:hypothetical protein n=1 Tax=Gordonia sihwensis TaxID=173559 RepID=UPI0005EE2AFF|nr:hypothetical protein [Gordonia sihwensis]KJR10478.1 hypothetical protein UG54_00300 [Gordonia sihwensis]
MTITDPGSAIDDADAAIDADLAEMELVDQAPATDGEVVDIASTPCTEEEARALIKKAVTAANTFYEAVGELLSRKGHVALGYDSPRQMLSRELAGMLQNPRTGEPISDTHLRRMTRVAWLAWSIAQSTGIDMSMLHITERQVRSISAASAGADDTDLIDDIKDRLTELKPTGPEQINDIITDRLETYEERTARKEQQASVPAHADNDDDDDEAGAPSGGPSGGGSPRDGRASRPRADSTDDGDVDMDDDGIDDVPAEAPVPAPPAPKPSVTSIFDTAMPEGAVEVSDFDVSSALVHMRSAADVRRAMHDAVRILELLPEIAKIEKSVPHVIDAVDDDDLDAIRKELTGTEAATKWATKTLAVIAEALEEVDTRIDEAV